MAPRPEVRAVAAVVVTVCLLLPTVWGGSAQDPEVADDPCESSGGPMSDLDATDIRSGWIRHRDDEVVVELCREPDPTTVEATYQGWQFRWTDGDGAEWEIRAWVEPDETSFGPEFHQITCRTSPEGDRGNVGEDQDPFRTGYPKLDGTRLILNFPPAGTQVALARYEQTHILGGEYSRETDPRDRDCFTEFTVADRAPDQGYGDPLTLEAEGTTDAGVVLQVADDDRSVPRNGSGAWSLVLGNEADDPRNVTLTARSEAPSDLRLGRRSISLEPEGNATVNLTADVPSDAATGGYTVNLTATIADPDGDTLRTIRRELGLTIVRRPGAASVTVDPEIRTAPPGGRTAYDVVLHNPGPQTERYELDILGGPASWGEISPDTIDVPPGEQIDATLILSVPAETDLGAHRFTVIARSTSSNLTAQMEGTVSVQEVAYPPPAPAARMQAMPGPGPWMVVSLVAAIWLTRHLRSDR